MKVTGTVLEVVPIRFWDLGRYSLPCAVTPKPLWVFHLPRELVITDTCLTKRTR